VDVQGGSSKVLNDHYISVFYSSMKNDQNWLLCPGLAHVIGISTSRSAIAGKSRCSVCKL